MKGNSCGIYYHWLFFMYGYRSGADGEEYDERCQLLTELSEHQKKKGKKQEDAVKVAEIRKRAIVALTEEKKNGIFIRVHVHTLNNPAQCRIQRIRIARHLTPLHL